MSILAQQNLATRLLDDIFSLDPYAIVAGGAPRDWYLGTEASDIDIFLYPHPRWGTGLFEKLLKKHIGSSVQAVGPRDDDLQYKMNPHLKTVYNATIEGESVQFMRMTEPTQRSVIPHFPLSLSKVWFKGGKIHPYPIFTKSVQEKIIVKTHEGYADIHRYIEKIQNKFPDYRYFSSAEDMLLGIEMEKR